MGNKQVNEQGGHSSKATIGNYMINSTGIISTNELPDGLIPNLFLIA